MMASWEGGLVKGRIYIPPCQNVVCESWVGKLNETLKPDLKCETTHCINGSFRSHFKQFLQNCDFTILHYCPHLWKRISSLETTLNGQENKIILVRFEDKLLNQSEEKTKEEKCEGLENFFNDFNSTQTIWDDEDNRNSFKDKVLLCIESLPESSGPQTDGLMSGQVTSTTQIQSKQLEIIGDESENEEEDSSNSSKFDKYPGTVDPGSSHVQTLVKENFVQLAPYKEFEFHERDIKTLKKRAQLINELEDRHTRTEVISTLKHLLYKVLPALYDDRNLVQLASFSMVRHPHLHKQAFDFLEFLFLENDGAVQDFTTLINMELILRQALSEFESYHNTSSDLSRLQRVVNLYLLLIGSLYIQSEEKPETSGKCTNFLHGRSESPLVTSKSSQQTDADKCLGIINDVLAQASKHKHVLKSSVQTTMVLDNDQDSKQSWNRAVQLVVLIRLLRKVFDLDNKAISSLNRYLSKTDTKNNFSYLILHALTIFLTNKTTKNTHKDINNICTVALDIIRLIPLELPKQFDILQRLLFHSISSIRGAMIEIFRSGDSYGDCMHVYLQNEIEYQLSPLLNKFKRLPDPPNEKTFGWKKAQGIFMDTEVCIFYHFMTEKSHKMHGASFKENDFHFTEMQRLACVQHRNIIKMFACHSDCIPQFYVTENCERKLQGNLMNRRDNEHFYTPSELLQFLLDAMSAVIYCHGNGYAHRNLTSESLIVVNDNHVKLGGFGLSKWIEPSTGKLMEINNKGIPLRWSAPESILEGKYSTASDIWMVGHLIYEVMTHGLLPYSSMKKTDEELIEMMKSQELKLMLDPVPYKIGIQEILLPCVEYNEERRPNAVNVRTSLKHLLAEANNGPQKKPMFPKLKDDRGKIIKELSTNFTRGIPQKYQERTTVKSSSWIREIRHSESITEITEGGDFIFREKIYHHLTSAMVSFFSSTFLHDILPRERKVVQYAVEMQHIECRITNEKCFSLLNVASTRMVKTVEEILFFISDVANILVSLSKHSCIIGDISASNVFVELTDTPKIHIISLAYLRNLKEELSQSTDEDITKSLPNDVKRRAAPEILQNGSFSAASDVFCFGNFMWELLTAFNYGIEHRKIFLQKKLKVFNELDVPEICVAIQSGRWEKENPKPVCCPNRLYDLIKLCVSVMEIDRPTIDHVAVKLREICNPTNEVADSASTISTATSLREVNPSSCPQNSVIGSASSTTGTSVADSDSTHSSGKSLRGAMNFFKK